MFSTQTVLNLKVISASRRTDIPAFHAEWFIRRLREGYVYARNPYSGRLLRVSLMPEDIQSVVFWSKNFTPLISKIETVEKTTKRLFFHFTITAVSKDIECGTPHYKDAIKDLIYLSNRYSPEHIIWRFDPIVITKHLTLDYYKDMFTTYTEELKGHVRNCYISFMHPYRKVMVNFSRHNKHGLLYIPTEERMAFAEDLAMIARRMGSKLHTCCNDYLLSDNIFKGSCINGERLANLFGDPPISSQPIPTRKGCGCTRSVDIGSYDTCLHGCIYCYANTTKEKTTVSYKRHNIEWNGLGFHVEDG